MTAAVIMLAVTLVVSLYALACLAQTVAELETRVAEAERLLSQTQRHPQ